MKYGVWCHILNKMLWEPSGCSGINKMSTGGDKKQGKACGKRYAQVTGLDFEETFAPVAMLTQFTYY
jgi:hypothetical protein